MNGKKAKKLRKKFGYHPNQERQYSIINNTVVNIGKRQEYLDAKRGYNE